MPVERGSFRDKQRQSYGRFSGLAGIPHSPDIPFRYKPGRNIDIVSGFFQFDRDFNQNTAEEWRALSPLPNLPLARHDLFGSCPNAAVSVSGGEEMRWGHFSKHNWGKGSGREACGSDSYHNGGVRGEHFARWYDKHLSDRFDGKDLHHTSWWGKHDRNEDAENGSGTGGSAGHGSHGLGRSKGSGGTDSCGSGSYGGSSGGKGEHGKGEYKGNNGGKHWWHHERDEEACASHGSGGTDGSGGAAGSGWASGSHGSCRTGGTGGSGGTGGDETGVDDGKTTINFTLGDERQIDVEVTQTSQGQLFISLSPNSYDGEVADIDGLFFNLRDDSRADDLNFHPNESSPPVTGHSANANGETSLDNGAAVANAYDAHVQFGQVADSTEGAVNAVNFTLWSDDGALTLQDLDLTNISLVINSDGANPEAVTGGLTDEAQALVDIDPGSAGGRPLASWSETNPVTVTPPAGTPDVMTLMSVPAEDLVFPEEPLGIEEDPMDETV